MKSFIINYILILLLIKIIIIIIIIIIIWVVKNIGWRNADDVIMIKMDYSYKLKWWLFRTHLQHSTC
ncbi:MAG: hypothetical protein N7Q72_01180, partial [Spiroplasma sp. Tabriz.8]|nr:hypothetical protein [Spiroplasma sp. Tabriz.8]